MRRASHYAPRSLRRSLLSQITRCRIRTATPSISRPRYELETSRSSRRVASDRYRYILSHRDLYDRRAATKVNCHPVCKAPVLLGTSPAFQSICASASRLELGPLPPASSTSNYTSCRLHHLSGKLSYRLSSNGKLNKYKHAHPCWDRLTLSRIPPHLRQPAASC